MASLELAIVVLQLTLNTVGHNRRRWLVRQVPRCLFYGVHYGQSLVLLPRLGNNLHTDG